ncbi:serine--tRNA ligase [Sulfobacillus thermosulfidooxidans]|uniref:serine--tRNA ligase n=1 Tax=Sulfobacillus thermosulfidooxidans TaxID=28034 RepID=UPI00096B99E8|nr:serine--tRNA ligase [Sulfobacillus thermosulfidooxidans]OLZ08990.1 serine--tRNA ligase [Sulfobacillus thermosulfidooxidans]OLZ14176.1 serine--tRNA ligase [Sulfobacillus thermosulfidooxidans]OLZ18919.1 serine--tRNA ligase [Sulfobacillus thermosulfidooxidans]
MLDIRRIRQEPEVVAQLLAKKHVHVDLDIVKRLDAKKREITLEIERLKARRNQASEEVSQRKKRGEDASDLIAETRRVGEQIKELEASVAPIDQELQDFLLTVPNTPLPQVPDGESADDNVEIHKFGHVPHFSFPAKAHWDIGENLGIIDFERARKISGSRFNVLAGMGARLSRALINFMLDHARNRGYMEMATPYLVNEASMFGTGQFPKFVEDVFHVVPHDYYLIPTAEVPLTNLFRDEIIQDALPLKFTAYTASFRAEAGAAGRDTRGLIRQHQFDKVELVRFEEPNNSQAALEEMLRDAETVLEDLNLPYRTVMLCGGDMGFGQALTYDIEVWMPSYGKYVEISSVSNMTDFQARRANIRYRPKGAKKTELVHTLNGSALAVGRTIAAILENYQLPNGHVQVPDVLVPYLGGTEQI